MSAENVICLDVSPKLEAQISNKIDLYFISLSNIHNHCSEIENKTEKNIRR